MQTPQAQSHGMAAEAKLVASQLALPAGCWTGANSNRWKYTMKARATSWTHPDTMHPFVYTVHLRDTLLRNPVQDGIAQVDAMPCLTDAVDLNTFLQAWREPMQWIQVPSCKLGVK